jgi:hypothetical protein
VAGRDSAGIHIVVSGGAGQWTEASRPRWRELSRVRQVETDTNYQFGNVVAADLGTDGTIFLLDLSSGRIRAFDSTGRFLRSMSRRGTGPGEIGATASTLIATSGDTLLVVDPGGQKASIFSSDGVPLGSFDTPISDGVPIKWMERNDGTVIVQVRQFDISATTGRVTGMGTAAPGRAGGAVTTAGDQLQIRSIQGNVLDTLLTLPAGETLKAGGELGMRAVVFAPEPVWTTAQDGRVFFGINSEYSINVYDAAGSLARIVRKEVQRAVVTEADKVAILDGIRVALRRMGIPAQTLDQITGMYEFAEYFPAIGNLLGGPDGTLWVQQPLTPEALRTAFADGATQVTGSQHWDVYGTDGAMLGTIEMPERFTALQWVREKLVGVQVDEFGVQNVVVFTLADPVSPG